MDGRTPSPPIPVLPSGSAGSSPHNPRKRTNDEVYFRDQIVHTSHPRSTETSKRPSTAPEQNILQQQSSFEQNGFGTLRPKHDTTSFTSTRSTMQPESTGASTNTTIESTRIFQDTMRVFQDRLDEEYKVFEHKLNERDQDAELEEFDWDDLEARYHIAIDPKVEAEQEVMNECSHLFQVIRSSV
jgi:hypothetical protein